MAQKPFHQEIYLGDDVYASHDGYQIWLRTGDGIAHRIALDRRVMANLKAFEEQMTAPDVIG